MGSWYMKLSDCMGDDGCLWKFNSMGGGGQKKCLLPSPSIFLGKALSPSMKFQNHIFNFDFNFHDYLIHGLQPFILAASSPR